MQRDIFQKCMLQLLSLPQRSPGCPCSTRSSPSHSACTTWPPHSAPMTAPFPAATHLPGRAPVPPCRPTTMRRAAARSGWACPRRCRHCSNQMKMNGGGDSEKMLAKSLSLHNLAISFRSNDDFLSGYHLPTGQSPSHPCWPTTTRRTAARSCWSCPRRCKCYNNRMKTDSGTDSEKMWSKSLSLHNLITSFSSDGDSLLGLYMPTRQSLNPPHRVYHRLTTTIGTAARWSWTCPCCCRHCNNRIKTDGSGDWEKMWYLKILRTSPLMKDLSQFPSSVFLIHQLK